MSNKIALCAAIKIDDRQVAAPLWVHLLPAGQAYTRDGRGPYQIGDASGVIASSLAESGGKMVLCENHSTDLAAPKGGAAPARGWIVDLQQRADGIWGRVDWTDEGRRLVETREYRGVSPVIVHKTDGTITQILRASLVNQPNIRGLTSLHMETVPVKMDAIDNTIAEYLGIDPERYLELLKDSPDFRQKIEPMRQHYIEQQKTALQMSEAKGDLNKADQTIIAMMGLDPEQYRKQAAVQGMDAALHAIAPLRGADQAVVRMMNLDPREYLKTALLPFIQ